MFQQFTIMKNSGTILLWNLLSLLDRQSKSFAVIVLLWFSVSILLNQSLNKLNLFTISYEMDP